MYQKVLVPLDGSNLAECALSHVETLINEGSAGEVTLLNIVQFEIPWADMDDRKPVDINALRESVLDASRRYLTAAASRLSAKGIKVKTESIEANRPAEAILDYARQQGKDLIVMATHGRTGFKKLMLGSVAFAVLNGSPVPVLLIRPGSCAL